MTELRALGYVGIGTARLDDWSAFATGWLGLHEVERRTTIAGFRMDDHAQRLWLDRDLTQGDAVFGWQVEDAAALERLAGRLDRAGIALRAEPAALADRRRVRGLISFADPAGHRLEA